LRVLIAHNRYRAAGGEERHVELLDRGLTAAGVNVWRFERKSTDLDGSLFRKSATTLGLAYRPGAGGIPRILRLRRPTVVHFHNIWPLLTPSALRAAKHSGATVVLTIHNYRFACPGGTLLRHGLVHDDCIQGSSLRCGLRNSRGNRVESFAYGVALEIQRRAGMLRRWVDAFIAPSEFMAEMLVRSGLPQERVYVVPYGLPLPAETPAPERRHVLFVGRLVAEKGVRTLLAAARLRPDVPIVIAGDGTLAPAAKAVSHNVRYAGRLDRADIAKALSEAAFTVVPSEWHDNLPFAALESFAAGRAVVATRMGGLPEIVDHGMTGLTVPPNDPLALAAAMGRLWDDHQRAADMGRRARTVAESRFHIDQQTAEHLRLYGRLAKGGRG
jgi:glycosyltransferase involved in cell wall biosynthesis